MNPLNAIEIETLQAMHHDHPSRRARMRAHGILLSHQHYPIHDIARFYQVSRHSPELNLIEILWRFMKYYLGAHELGIILKIDNRQAFEQL